MKDIERIERRLGKIEKKLCSVHDDVLVMKTQRDMTMKFVLFVASGVSLIVTSIIGWINGR